MSDLDKLQEDYERAEQRMHELQAEKDEALARVLELGERQQEAVAEAREAQKALCDAQAVEALRDRPDGESLADALGLELS